MTETGLHHLHHHQLTLDLDGLLAHWGYDPKTEDGWREFARDHRLPRDFVKQLREHTWSDLPRRTLLILLTLARAKGLPSPLSLARNPIWASFDGRRAEGFVGIANDRSLVAPDHSILSDWSSRRGIKIAVCRPEPMTDDRLVDFVKTANCIFIGAPKYNCFTTQVLNLLWPPLTLNGPSSLPITFSGPNWPEGPFVHARAEATKRELYFGGRRRFSEESGRLGGFAALCRSPLGTKEYVTTIVVAGCSAEATKTMANELIESELVVDESKLVPGRPLAFLFDSKVARKRWQPLLIR